MTAPYLRPTCLLIKRSQQMPRPDHNVETSGVTLGMGWVPDRRDSQGPSRPAAAGEARGESSSPSRAYGGQKPSRRCRFASSILRPLATQPTLPCRRWHLDASPMLRPLANQPTQPRHRRHLDAATPLANLVRCTIRPAKARGRQGSSVARGGPAEDRVRFRGPRALRGCTGDGSTECP